jgi:hypothetical protein
MPGLYDENAAIVAVLVRRFLLVRTPELDI